MLGGQEKVVMFVEQSAVQSDQRLPLVVSELIGRCGLLLVDLDTCFLDPHQASANAWKEQSSQHISSAEIELKSAFDLINQLLLCNGTGLGL
jgi:hypothetical protein